MSDLVRVGQKQTDTDAPADLKNVTFVGQWTGGHNGTDSLRMLERIRGQCLFLPTFKVMNTNVSVTLALGHPDDGGLDRLNFVFGEDIDGVLATKEIARLEMVDAIFEPNLQGGRNQCTFGLVSN